MKILGSDYDGTLRYGGIDDKKREAISLWRKKGNKFGIVSGRGHHFLSEEPKKCEIECDFLVAYNGGMVLTPENEILFSVKCFDVEPISFVETLFSYGCDFVHMNNKDYFKIRKYEKDLEKGDSTLGDYLLKDAPPIPFFYQVSVQLKDNEDAKRVVKLIEKDYGDKLTPLQNGICIDIVPKGVNKAFGLMKVAEIYGAAHDDIIAVGDDVNDYAMIKEYRSYAMANGVDLIKSTATFITESVTDLIYKELE